MNTVPLTRVELHVHLDGAIRPETIWEISKEKNIPLPGNGSFKALKDALVITDPIDLAHFLQPFGIITPCLIDDLELMERCAFEFIEDKAREGVAYVEVRYAPHGLLSDGYRDMPHMEELVTSVARGLVRGRETYGVESRQILCTLIGQNTAEEVFNLCQRTRELGVVGIDTASVNNSGPDNTDEVPADGPVPSIFQRAAQENLHRTVHAGERGPALMVKRAMELYSAERIGHGYRVLEDQTIYNELLAAGTHLECCPYSSLLTGAVPMGVKKHPIVRFAEDQANFSINTDDPTITGHILPEDYAKIQSWSISEANAVRATLNAANSCFMTKTEIALLKKRLLAEILPHDF